MSGKCGVEFGERLERCENTVGLSTDVKNKFRDTL